MRTRLFHRLAATLALAAIIASLTASSAAAASARPAKGAPPSTIVGTKKGSKLDALTAPSVASFAAPARPNLRAQHRAQAELNQIKKQPYVPGQLIIKYKKNVTAAQAAAVRNEIKGTTLRKLDGGAELIQLAPGASALSISKSVARKTEIEYAEPNYIITKFDVTPTDALFGQLWGLKNTGQTAGTDGPGTAGIDIKAPLAWETTQGDSDLVVAVIDEGIDFSHPDLAGRAWVNPGEIPGDGIDNDNNGYIDDINGWDFAHDDNTVFDVIDGDQHGTHVAGTIAASMDSLGVVGVAPNVKIASLKFLTDTAPNDTANAIEAIAYARKMGFKIINNSWGQYAYSQALKEAIESSYDTLFVAAAGNASYDMDNPMTVKAYPAAYDLPNVISVAGIDNRGDLGWYSNWGATSVDVAAPGSQIFSTFPMNHILRGAAVTNQTAAYKTVTLGFGLEDLTTGAQRTTLVNSVLSFFGADASTPITVILDDESTSDPTGTAYPSMRDEFEAALSGRANVTYHQLAHDAAITSDLLDPGHIVFWTTGQALGANHAEYRTLTDADLTNIAAYLNAGGRLFLSGQDALYGSELESVVTDMLGVDWQDEGATDTQLQGVSASLFDSQTFTLHDWPETYRDYLEPNPAVATARRVITWPQGGAAKFEYMSGTSMASPHVAGVAALIKSVNQNMTPAQIRERIINTVTPLPDLAYKTVSGGMVDAAKALAYNPDNDVPGVPFPSWGAEVADRLDGATNTDMDDVYAIPLEAGQPIRATLTGADATDYDLYIYMPGTPTVNDVAYIAAGSENPGSAEAVNFVAPVSGIYYIDVFAYQGEGSYTLRVEWGNGPGSYEDNDSRLTYSGTWYDMGSWKESRAAGATAELKFYGNQVVLYGTKGPNMGLAAIGVNGVMQQVDLYAPVLTNNVPVYTKAGLPMTNQANVLTVRNLGQRSPQGRRTAISVGLDRVDVFVDTAAPPAVATIEAYPSDGSVELYWQYDRAVVPDFAYFQVYRATDGGALEPMVQLQPVPASQGPRRAAAGAALSMMPWYYFEDLSAINGHDYTYMITAFDISGNESDDSPAVTAHPDPAPAPVTPHVQNLDGAVSIWWEPGTEPDLSHYLVLRLQEGDPFPVVIATIPHDGDQETLDYLDDSVLNETDYIYAVVAVDVHGVWSDVIDEAAAHPSAAPAPVPYVEAYTHNGTIDLTWIPVSEPDITYLVERDMGDGSTEEVAASSLDRVTGLTANTAAPGLYYITSVDEWGVYGMPVAVATWPYQPLTVTPGNGQLTVTWATVPGATGYEVMTEGYVAPLPETATTFTLTDLTNGVEVCVWVEALTGTTAHAQSASVCATPVMPDPPAAPSIATLTPGDRQMVITWNSVPDVDGYNVYRDGTRLNAGALDPIATSWTDTLSNNLERCWTVTSVKNGQESAHSAPACAVPTDTENPAAPTDLTVTDAVGDVELTWTASTAADLDHYTIWRDGQSVGLVGPTVTYFADTPPVDGTTYTYYVTAVDDDGLVSPSNTVTVRPHDGAAPLAPVGVTITAGDGTVLLEWLAPESVDVVGYNVYRSTTPGEVGSKLNETPLTTRSFVDSAVTNGTTYYYTLTAVDWGNLESAGTAQFSATPTGSVGPPPDTTAPSVPTGVQASAGDQVVNVSWSASTDDSGMAPTYRVFWGTGSTEPATWTEVPISFTGTSWSHTGLTNGTTYWYRVVARDGAGNVSGESVKKWAMPNVAGVGPGLYENNSSAVVLSPSPTSWSTSTAASHSGGTASYSNTNGAMASLRFTGTGIEWWALKAAPYGIVAVYIDGVHVADVDVYSGTTQYRQPVFVHTGLSDGVHEIRIVRTGTKNPGASGTFINIDAFKVS